jgi:hypothetical protein
MPSSMAMRVWWGLSLEAQPWKNEVLFSPPCETSKWGRGAGLNHLFTCTLISFITLFLMTTFFPYGRRDRAWRLSWHLEVRSAPIPIPWNPFRFTRRYLRAYPASRPRQHTRRSRWRSRAGCTPLRRAPDVVSALPGAPIADSLEAAWFPGWGQ